MKLLFLAPSAYLLGGVQDWLAQLVPDLRGRGHGVTVTVPEGDHHRHAAYGQAYPALAPLPFRNRTGSREGRLRALERVLLRHPADVIVGVNLGDLYGVVRRLRRRGVLAGRVAMTLHAIEADYLADLRAEREVIDAVITTNRLSCELATHRGGLPPERVLYAPYGVPLPAAVSGRGDPRSELRLAWVGRFEQLQKRIHDLPRILLGLEASGAPWSLSLAGDGPERASIEEALGPWQRSGRVRFLGKLPKQALHREVYGAHHALLITSSWETGPIVAWEAMAAGMAVVSSAYLGSGREGALVEGTTALLFPVGDAETAARQLLRLRDPALLEHLARGGRELVGSRYSRQASLAAWEEAFATVLRLPPLPPPGPGAAAPASGRLEAWLGAGVAERMREAAGLRFRHTEAGSEWPHSAHRGIEHEKLLREAAALERHAC